MQIELATSPVSAKGIEATLLGRDLHLSQADIADAVIVLTDEQAGKVQEGLKKLDAALGTLDEPVLLSERFPCSGIARHPYQGSHRDLQITDAEVVLRNGDLIIRRGASEFLIALEPDQASGMAIEMQYCFSSNAPRAHAIEDDQSGSDEVSRLDADLTYAFDLRDGRLPSISRSQSYLRHIEKLLSCEIDPRILDASTASPHVITQLIDRLQDRIYERIRLRSDPVTCVESSKQGLQDGLEMLRKDAALRSFYDIETGEHFAIRGRARVLRAEDSRVVVRPTVADGADVSRLLQGVAEFVVGCSDVTSFKVLGDSFFTRRDPIVIYLKDGTQRQQIARELALKLGYSAQVRRCSGYLLSKFDNRGVKCDEQITPTKREAYECAILVVEKMIGRPLEAKSFAPADGKFRHWNKLTRLEALLELMGR